MSELFPISLDDMIAEVDEELRYRGQVFPRRMQDAGLALRNRLQRRWNVMRAVKERLEADRNLEQRRTVE
jgi:hypothetical protein